MTFYIVALTLLQTVCSQLTVAQNTITGTITSEENGESLPGVTILVKGTGDGTISSVDGEFSIAAAPNDTLVFSSVGFETQQVLVGNQTVINIILAPDLEVLKEVVVIGYGGVRKRDLTGSVATVTSEQLQTVPALNAIDALQGQVAGLQITNDSGAPGAAPVVRIRGVGTTGNTSPLYVVDGVLLNDITWLNSFDIESINVLKDASATAIYGNRGANGVIIIETKGGDNRNGGSTIGFNSYYGVQIQQNTIDLLNAQEYAEVRNVIAPGTFNNIDGSGTDWQDLIFESAPIQSHNVSISGSGKQNDYYFSLGYFGQDGVIPESRYQRVTLKVNESYRVKKYLTVGTNLTISAFWQDNTRTDAPFNAYRANPIVEPFDAEGNFNPVEDVGNILADLAFTTDNQTSGVRTIGNVFMEGKFLKHFTAKSSLGVESLREINEVFVPEFFVSQEQQNAATNFFENRFERTAWVWENTINYDREFGPHRLNAVAGYTMQQVRNEQLSLGADSLFRSERDFRFFDQTNINSEQVTNGVRDFGDYFNQISYLARVNLSLFDRYLVTATYRRDGSSKFLQDNQYGNFYAFAGGWNLSNEAFLTLPKWVSNLKLRGSWGVVGNDKINYLGAYSVVDNNVNAVFGSDEQLNFGQTDGALGNENLQWEEVRQSNIGFEFGLFDYKLTGEIDYYLRKTTNTLIGLRPPAFSGNTADVIVNAGEFENKGIELSLSWLEKLGPVDFSVGANLTTINNETLQVSGVENANEIFGFAGGQTVSRTAEGLPIGAFFGYDVIGVYQTQEEVDNLPSFGNSQPGDLIYRDVNDDGVISEEDRTFLGSSIPELLYGLDISATFKNFSLALIFQGQAGNKIFNIKETIRPDPYNWEQRAINYWRGPGTSNSEPRPTAGGNNYEPSSHYIQNGGFFRLRTVTLSYAIPETLLEKLNLQTAGVFLRGNNVFTITDFTGYSPEIANGNPLINGVSLGTFPVASTYSLGLNLTF
ncbi:MAG: TonB-dependent receptor [Bacteroidota bacterium]